MKALIITQRLIATMVGIFGFLTMFGETPIEQGLEAQLWVTLGGIAILGISLIWLWLTDKETEYFIHEAR